MEVLFHRNTDFTGLRAGFKNGALVSPRKRNQPRIKFDLPPVVEGAGVGALWEVAAPLHTRSFPGFLLRPQPISSMIQLSAGVFRVFPPFLVFSLVFIVFSVFPISVSLVIPAAQAFSLGGSVGEEATLSIETIHCIERFVAVLLRHIVKILMKPAALSLSDGIRRTLRSGLGPREVCFCEQQGDLIFSVKNISLLMRGPLL